MRINQSDDDGDDMLDDLAEIEAQVDRLCTPEYLAAKWQEIKLRVHGYPAYCSGRSVLHRRRR